MSFHPDRSRRWQHRGLNEAEEADFTSTSYAPVLRPLRPLAKIVRFTPPTSAMLVKRLRTICESEELTTENKHLSLLVEVAEGDLRSCLNTLQVRLHGVECSLRLLTRHAGPLRCSSLSVMVRPLTPRRSVRAHSVRKTRARRRRKCSTVSSRSRPANVVLPARAASESTNATSPGLSETSRRAANTRRSLKVSLQRFAG